MTDISRQAGQPLPRKGRPHPVAVAGTTVPVIPRWIAEWGGIPLALGVLIVIALIWRIGEVYGASNGWALAGALAAVIVGPWWLGYVRRRDAAEARQEQALYEMSQFEKLDVMTGSGFEEYCAELLRALGCKDVVVTGSTKEDHGADLTAIAPDGIRVAVQCKRQKVSVGPEVIRGLEGTITSGRHQGRKGILMTNATATAGAHSRAEGSGITVVDRVILRQWIAQARTKIEQRRVHGMRPAAKAAVAVLGISAIVVSFVGYQIATSVPSTAPAPSAPSVAPTRSALPDAASPGSVVRSFFAAINKHDWQKVWQLGGKNLGYGQYASYRGMISGYRLTARDVVTNLSVRGDSVAGRILAYETTGAIQAYSFTYVVRGEAIVSGQQVLLGTSYSR